MKNKSVYISRIIISLLGLLVFAALIFWIIVGLDSTKSVSDEQRLLNVKQAVVNGAVMCYSVEGFYPDDIGYLKEHYGLTFDENRYDVTYGFTAPDKRPNVMVSEKNLFAEVAG